MRIAPILLLAGTALSAPAFALDTCAMSPQDVQTRICIYSPTQRYVVNGLVGFPVNLQFDPGERIERFEPAYTAKDAAGNPAPAWRGAKAVEERTAPVAGGAAATGGPAKDQFLNNLPIWPFAAGRSSLIVVTVTADGKERPYLFDLTARTPIENCEAVKGGAGCPDDLTTTATLQFTNPADEAAEAAKKKQAATIAFRAKQAKAQEQAGIDRMKLDPLYGKRNFAYQAKAEPRFKELAPSEVSDNGWLTEFQWPGNVQVPAIAILDPATGDERVVTTTMRGGLVIVNGTAPAFRLRLGRGVMDIVNQAWSPDQPDPKTGTTSPDVVRQVTYAEDKP